MLSNMNERNILATKLVTPTYYNRKILFHFVVWSVQNKSQVATLYLVFSPLNFRTTNVVIVKTEQIVIVKRKSRKQRQNSESVFLGVWKFKSIRIKSSMKMVQQGFMLSAILVITVFVNNCKCLFSMIFHDFQWFSRMSFWKRIRVNPDM